MRVGTARSIARVSGPSIAQRLQRRHRKDRRCRHGSDHGVRVDGEARARRLSGRRRARVSTCPTEAMHAVLDDVEICCGSFSYTFHAGHGRASCQACRRCCEECVSGGPRDLYRFTLVVLSPRVDKIPRGIVPPLKGATVKAFSMPRQEVRRATLPSWRRDNETLCLCCRPSVRKRFPTPAGLNRSASNRCTHRARELRSRDSLPGTIVLCPRARLAFGGDAACDGTSTRMAMKAPGLMLHAHTSAAIGCASMSRRSVLHAPR